LRVLPFGGSEVAGGEGEGDFEEVNSHLPVYSHPRAVLTALLFPLIFFAEAFGQEAEKFDLMLDYQALNFSNISSHPGAFLHFSPFISGQRLDFILGTDMTIDEGGVNEVTLFEKFGGYWNQNNASYWVLGESFRETQPLYAGLEHQYRFFETRHFSCHANAQIFLPVPAMDVEYSAFRFASAGILLRIF
jgi:hypothetical protein